MPASQTGKDSTSGANVALNAENESRNSNDSEFLKGRGKTDKYGVYRGMGKDTAVSRVISTIEDQPCKFRHWLCE
jgi:hypothetical protein